MDLLKTSVEHKGFLTHESLIKSLKRGKVSNPIIVVAIKGVLGSSKVEE